MNSTERPEALNAIDREILRLLACGKSVPEIAIVLDLSPRAIRYRIESLMRRWDCYRQTRLVAIAFTRGEISIDDKLTVA